MFSLKQAIARNKRQTVATVTAKYIHTWKDDKGILRMKPLVLQGVGATIRSLEDKDIPQIGEYLALADALDHLSRQLKREAWDKIHQMNAHRSELQCYNDDELKDLAISATKMLVDRDAEREERKRIAAEMANTPEAIAIRKDRAKKKKAEVKQEKAA